MENPSHISSQEELAQLRQEGKITEAEYRDLLAAMQSPTATRTEPQSPAEPEFKAFRQRILTGSLVLCIVGLPVGLALRLPYVWLLSIAGIIVAAIKLSRMKGSWLAEFLDRRTQV